jgi:hypothetical protein
MTSTELALAIQQTQQIADVFAERARQGWLDNEPGTYLENIRKFEECQRWITGFKSEVAEPASHFDNV